MFTAAGTFQLRSTACRANTCTATEVPFSNKATSSSITGTTGAVVIVTCNAGYTGGGNATCGTGGTFNNLTCSATTCNCPSGTATLATGAGGTLCEANNTVDCSACGSGFTLSSSAGVGLQSCIGELCCFVLVHIYYDSCDHIVRCCKLGGDSLFLFLFLFVCLLPVSSVMKSSREYMHRALVTLGYI